ncbi:hypothetical protein DYBT9623_02343 [Dyadobacter sp. CECT 9623]|uniref:Uncharacterized protein n=1 Tax=Dyadobacter linearis TaxID=2823330 RepID=A0ABN7R7W8_9BACT|nr:hypothetical protein DYBT9623_02343 [Dyadobacter sp. CECT 9623]
MEVGKIRYFDRTYVNPMFETGQIIYIYEAN